MSFADGSSGKSVGKIFTTPWKIFYWINISKSVMILILGNNKLARVYKQYIPAYENSTSLHNN